MRKTVIIIGLLALVVLGSIVVWSVNQANRKGERLNNDIQTPQQITNQKALTQTNQQGAVSVDITWANPDRNENSLKLDIVMNTHSVDLSSYNLVQNTEVYIDNQKITSKLVLSTQGESHHLESVLTVPDVNLKQAKTFRVVLKNLDKIATRTFTWDLLQLGVK